VCRNANFPLNLTQLISEDRFRALDKIKTIGSTYMAAVGLIPEYKILDENEDGGLSAVHYMAQVPILLNLLYRPEE
jgi:hypothetical protein